MYTVLGNKELSDLVWGIPGLLFDIIRTGVEETRSGVWAACWLLKQPGDGACHHKHICCMSASGKSRPILWYEAPYSFQTDFDCAIWVDFSTYSPPIVLDEHIPYAPNLPCSMDHTWLPPAAVVVNIVGWVGRNTDGASWPLVMAE